MTHVVMVKGVTGRMTGRLAEVLEAALPGVPVTRAMTSAHAAAEASGGLVLSVVVRADEVRLEWGRPYRDEDAREVEWLTGVVRPVLRVYDPEAKLHGPGKGARVVDAEALAVLVAKELGQPPAPELVEVLHETAARTAEAEADLVAARTARDAAVRAAVKGGVPVQSVMDATGLVRSRVYQIVNGGGGE